jgi:hypothetical protein
MRASVVLAHQIERLEGFKREFLKYSDMSKAAASELEERRALRPREIVPDEAEEFQVYEPVYKQRHVVGEKSGPAGEAVEQANVWMMIGGKQLNAVRSWSQAFENPIIFNDDDVIDCTNQALGVLRSRYEEARRRERSLAGLLGRFVRFPQDVREAAGFKSGTAGARAAVGAGIVAQILVVVISSVLVAYLLEFLNLR